jgi:hypothetical protein
MARRDRRWRTNKHMGVVVNAANLQRDHFMLTCTAADTRPDIIFDLRPDKIASVFGAKDKVKVNLREGLAMLFEISVGELYFRF